MKILLLLKYIDIFTIIWKKKLILFFKSRISIYNIIWNNKNLYLFIFNIYIIIQFNDLIKFFSYNMIILKISNLIDKLVFFWLLFYFSNFQFFFSFTTIYMFFNRKFKIFYNNTILYSSNITKKNTLGKMLD